MDKSTNMVLTVFVAVILGFSIWLALQPNEKFVAICDGVEPSHLLCCYEHDVFIINRPNLSVEQLVDLVNTSCSNMPTNGPARPEWR